MPGRTYADSLASDIESLSGIGPGNSSLLRNSTRPSKRRRTEGLNARYDRMIETANVVHRSSSSVDLSKRSGRQRAISSASGSSSVASHDIPRTPIDAYNNHIINTSSKEPPASNLSHSLTRSPSHHSDASMIIPTRSVEQKEQVPEWIYETVSSLDQYHPLRSIMHLPTVFTDQIDPNLDQYAHHHEPLVGNAVHDEEVFAFKPPAAPDPPHPSSFAELLPSNDQYAYQPTDASFADATGDLPLALDTNPYTDPIQDLLYRANNISQVPYTTPGPKATTFSHTNLPNGPLPYSKPHVLLSRDAQTDQGSPYSDSQPFTGPLGTSAHIYTPTTAQHTCIQSPYNNSSIPLPRPSDSDLEMYDFTNEASDTDQYSLSDILRSPSMSRLPDSASQPQSFDLLPPERARSNLQDYPSHTFDSQTANNPIPVASSLTPLSASHSPAPTEFKVYFDDPVEDPSDPSSDPLEEPDYQLDLDYGNIDFKWNRFDPAGISENTGAQNLNPNNFWTEQAIVSDDHLIDAIPVPLPRTPIRKLQDAVLAEELYPKHEASSTVYESSSGSQADQYKPSDESWTHYSRAGKTTNIQRSPNSPTEAPENRPFSSDARLSSTRLRTTVFAPGSGIYLSPLREKSKGENSPSQNPDQDAASSRKQQCMPERPINSRLVSPEVVSSAVAKATTSDRESWKSKTTTAPIKRQETTSDDDPVEPCTSLPQSQESNDSIESWSDDI